MLQLVVATLFLSFLKQFIIMCCFVFTKPTNFLVLAEKMVRMISMFPILKCLSLNQKEILVSVMDDVTKQYFVILHNCRHVTPMKKYNNYLNLRLIRPSYYLNCRKRT